MGYFRVTVSKILAEQIIFENYHIIDVRTPAEFIQGHIPHSTNIPLFTDEQRVEVGTLYKQSSPEIAFDRALELVGPFMSTFVTNARQLKGKPLLVYCWRGGMRSESMAWLFEMAGITVFKIEGGYKAYRRFIRSQFTHPHKIYILGGRTGSGKTRYLKNLQKEKEQVLDLEGLANHMGSSFGYKGTNIQPTNEQFENNCYDAWKNFDDTQIVWIEDESQQIGKVLIVDGLYNQMLKAPVIELKIPLKKRVKNILEDYKDIDQEILLDACSHIKKRFGTQRFLKTKELIIKGDYSSAILLLLEYYDALYDRYARKHPRQTISLNDPLLEDLLKVQF